MKKTFLIIFLLIIFITVTGCRNRKLSDEIYNDCKKTVEIVDDYLDKYISKDKANDMLHKVECNYDSDNEDELLVCIYVNGLQINFNSNNSTTAEIRAERDKLKKECGL